MFENIYIGGVFATFLNFILCVSTSQLLCFRLLISYAVYKPFAIYVYVCGFFSQKSGFFFHLFFKNDKINPKIVKYRTGIHYSNLSKFHFAFNIIFVPKLTFSQ